MNIYAVIILFTLIIDYLLNLIADIFNLKALQGEPPTELKDLYDPEAYRKSQEYTRVNIRFGFLTSTLGLAALLLFWFSGGFNLLDQVIRRWELGPIFTGLAYIGILLLLKGLLSLPFRIYSTFVIEEKFGFNRTTPSTFVLDMIKGLGLSVLLGGPFLAALLAFFEFAGSDAWWYGWTATTLFILLVQWIAPTWIMPIFNKFKPLEEGKLKEAILSYARSVDFPIENVFVIDGSRRSTKANAFFTGLGRQKRIALLDTLVEKQTLPELVAILAHEIGHYKKWHVILGMIISILHAGVIFYLLSLFISYPGLYDAFYMEHRSIYVGLLFFGMLYAPIEFILSIFIQTLSRKNEYEADRFAVETTHDSEAIVDALKKLSIDHLSQLTPHPFYVFLNYSHPPLRERIKAIQKKGAAHSLLRRAQERALS